MLSAAAVTTVAALELFSPIVSAGVVGIVLVAVLFRIKLMPTWVHDEALAARDQRLAALLAAKDEALAAKDAAHALVLAEWTRERAEHERQRAEWQAATKESTEVYTKQVIPLLVRVHDVLGTRGAP